MGVYLPDARIERPELLVARTLPPIGRHRYQVNRNHPLGRRVDIAWFGGRQDLTGRYLFTLSGTGGTFPGPRGEYLGTNGSNQRIEITPAPTYAAGSQYTITVCLRPGNLATSRYYWAFGRSGANTPLTMMRAETTGSGASFHAVIDGTGGSQVTTSDVGTLAANTITVVSVVVDRANNNVIRIYQDAGDALTSSSVSGITGNTTATSATLGNLQTVLGSGANTDYFYCIVHNEALPAEWVRRLHRRPHDLLRAV